MIIDISHHQDPYLIDYVKLCSQLDMAIVRVQYGSRTIDRHYKTHISEMKKNNVPFGVYAWVRGVSERDMEVEATDFYNRAKDLDPAFYVLDVEEESMTNMRTGINAYIKKLRLLTDKKVGIYIGHHLYEEFNLDLDKADFVWIPHYGVNNGQPNSIPDFPCDIHQYTSKGRLEGYSGDLDLNRLLGDKPLEFFTGDKDEVYVTKKEFEEFKSNLIKALKGSD
ncbi:glycoside hydrolase family 25 protein [Sporanaerobacter acetigenes]|uniref:glycoside hydrolase family 25 protein n=1 Tax=Sporanaerobacter acetigenes TaxID=165813 RepID=UPI00104834B4|nr:glycoside hydrolase family 25 protein [Sporanaerobacter acetigenes]